VLWFLPLVASAQSTCTGDCDGSGTVAINELILCVNVALGSSQLSTCEACDANGDGMVSINELIGAVNNALQGCTVGPTPTPTTSNCPLEKGHYTITSISGGSLQVATFSPFPFPAGGTIAGDVGEGDANCVHDVIVPNPGGFNAPVFCVPALGYLVKVAQTGCGVGEIDSNGGSDFTVSELGDTSDSSATCNIPQMCAPGKDSSVRIDVTVGDGTPDTCTSGTANSLVVVPVDTLTWQDNATDAHGNPITFPPGCAGAACTACAGNGTFDPPTDIKISEFPQILDFTTDKNTATWKDLDGDGCSLAGAGPASLSSTGVCMDLTNHTVTTVASGPVGTSALPYDLTFTNTLPNTFARDGDEIGATCDSPPAINFMGTVTRCIK
jgi:hypothetical protein